MRLEPRAAAGVGYLAGVVFFTLNFSWFGETAGALLGPFGFLLDLGPSLIEGLTFGLAAALASVAARRLHGEWIAIVAAAAFTLAEVLRSSGLLGVPLYQIGAAFVDTPLAPLAAFGGVYALTFAVALVGASLGAAGLRGELRHVARAGVPLRRMATADLPDALVMPEHFRHWTPLPAQVRRTPYDLAALLPRAGDADLFRPVSAPDAFLHEEPDYATWTPQVHQRPESGRQREEVRGQTSDVRGRRAEENTPNQGRGKSAPIPAPGP